MSKTIMIGTTYAILACYADKGMKSKGSKSLMEFNKKKLLDYQIDQINIGHKDNTPYEIIVITNFDSQKIEKNFHQKIKIYDLGSACNPIIRGCEVSKYKNIFFIDYGCIFNKKIIEQVPRNKSCVVTITSTKSELDIGIIHDEVTNLVKHMFFDLPNKFANMFFLQDIETNTLLSNPTIYRNNLMYFEILNYLIESGRNIYNHRVGGASSFIYFNNMRQKNGISKFIKTNQ